MIHQHVLSCQRLRQSGKIQVFKFDIKSHRKKDQSGWIKRVDCIEILPVIHKFLKCFFIFNILIIETTSKHLNIQAITTLKSEYIGGDMSNF